MPKLKTNRSAAKRFKVTGSGKIVRHHAKSAHIKTKKSPKLKRNLRSSEIVKKSDEKRIYRMLGL
ncbi:MAG: 50S ribosomal protein L35 [Candidatus Cloacimonas sp.]|jgi:large subunit ribosomal protein L35|nr:50S ribosomal protein L35 [Candidatus Cloacimonas sp.]HNW24760.1 50S ribosomal protein L35 [Candidatus Cloacimonas sp.]HNX02442.1 50S ribosomal protein L35 [Candidatus Cloacimonas sp.]HPS60473.1 50S ribosomal protein L35 [Candidatus Cloacimonas sp.]